MYRRAVMPFNQWAVPYERSWHPLGVLDNSMRELGQQFRDLEREMKEYGRMEPEIVEDGDACKYRLNFYMGKNFSPENIKVTLKDRVMKIEAKKEQKSDDGNSRVYEEVSRLFTIPEKVDLKEVKSVLTPDGILKVEAALPKEALPEPPKPQEIPILME